MSQQELMQQHCWHVAGPGYTRDYKGTADPRLPVEAAAAPLPVVTLPPFKATDVAKGTPVNQPPVRCFCMVLAATPSGIPVL